MFGVPSSERRQRYRDVAAVLTRHGMGAMSASLGLDRFAPSRLLRGASPPTTTAEHVRLAIEELGTTAIKLGQILSTRPDLIPAEYVVELEKLTDSVPAVPYAEIAAVIEREFGRPASEVFSEIDEVPLASASIGQVHTARLHDGTRVVVKVRKPGVAEDVTTDLAILADLARRPAAREMFGPYDIEAIVDDFAWTLRAELDYVREGRNADRIRETLADESEIVVPNVYWDYTTTEVLTLERLEGIRIGERERIRASGRALEPLAETLARALMKQVFGPGFFHADPHSGNFLLLQDGRVAMLDFGMCGQLDDEVRHTLLQMFVSIVEQNAAGITDELEHLGVLRSGSEREAVQRDVHHVMARYYGLGIDEFSLTEYVNDVLGVVRRHRLQLPVDLALVLKTVAMSEGLWRQLDPHFNAARVAEPFVEQAAAEMFKPKAWGRRVARAAGDTVELGTYLPGQIRRIAARLDRGELEVSLRHRELDDILNRLNGMVTRMALAIIAAAFILGLPVLAVTREPPGWRYIAPGWFVVGLVLAVVFVVLAARRFRR